MRHHPDEVGQQQAQSDDQDSGPLHVEPAESVKAGQGESETQQRDSQGAGTEDLPQPVPDRASDWAGDGDRQQGETNEQTQHQSRNGAESTAGVGAHTGTGTSVTRRSWKWGKTG